MGKGTEKVFKQIKKSTQIGKKNVRQEKGRLSKRQDKIWARIVLGILAVACCIGLAIYFLVNT